MRDHQLVILLHGEVRRHVGLLIGARVGVEEVGRLAAAQHQDPALQVLLLHILNLLIHN